MKVYGGVYDGRTRTIVLARSWAKAHACLVAAGVYGVSLHCMKTYGAVSGNEVEVALTLGKPGVVFQAPSNHRRADEYHELTKESK